MTNDLSFAFHVCNSFSISLEILWYIVDTNYAPFIILYNVLLLTIYTSVDEFSIQFFYQIHNSFWLEEISLKFFLLYHFFLIEYSIRENSLDDLDKVKIKMKMTRKELNRAYYTRSVSSRIIYFHRYFLQMCSSRATTGSEQLIYHFHTNMCNYNTHKQIKKKNMEAKNYSND